MRTLICLLGVAFISTLARARFEILPQSAYPSIGYAAEELARYLRLATDWPVVVVPPDKILASRNSEVPPMAPSPGTKIGLASAFENCPMPPLEDANLDDAYRIDMLGRVGTIAGSNPRAVLLGVYRYLTEIGFRWVRPGPDGESIPRLTTLPDVKVTEAAAYRHRGVHRRDEQRRACEDVDR